MGTLVGGGGPASPPRHALAGLHKGVSDKEAKLRADYDLGWKVVLGVEVERRPFAKSTLQEFRARFLVTAFYVKLGRGAGWDAARIDLMMVAGSVMLVLAGVGMLSVDQWQARRAPRPGQGEDQTVPSA